MADEISKKIKCKFYIAAGKNDLNLINKFKNSKVGKNSFSFENLNIKESLKYISNCDLYIGNDTGWAYIYRFKSESSNNFCDSPILAYGRYSNKMITVEPEGEENSTHTRYFG